MPYQLKGSKRGGGEKLASERAGLGSGLVQKMTPVWGASGSVNNVANGSIQLAFPCWVSKNIGGVLRQASGASGFPTTATPVQSFASAPASAGGTTTTLVSGVAGRIVIVMFILWQADANVTFKFQDTTPADLTPTLSAATGGVFQAYCEYGVLRTASGAGLSVVVTGATGNLNLVITYAQL
jgi:hypothetical protein